MKIEINDEVIDNIFVLKLKQEFVDIVTYMNSHSFNEIDRKDYNKYVKSLKRLLRYYMIRHEADEYIKEILNNVGK